MPAKTVSESDSQTNGKGREGEVKREGLRRRRRGRRTKRTDVEGVNVRDIVGEGAPQVEIPGQDMSIAFGEGREGMIPGSCFGDGGEEQARG